ncbi:MAG TPA: hypothetical protein VIC63_02840 [Candidatus Limnocylindria bacterium]|jgi:hypothetical protein
MSRGRPRHHGSRRRAYHARQREVKERQHRAPREDTDWILDASVVEDEPADSEPQPAWSLRLQGRAAAA